MPSPVRLTEAMRTESRSVRTSASERSRTAASITERSPRRRPGPNHWIPAFAGMTLSRERLLQLFEALHHFRRRLRGELALDHVGVKLHLGLPFGGLHGGGGGEAIGPDVIEAGEVELVRDAAERRVVGAGAALDALDDPLE